MKNFGTKIGLTLVIFSTLAACSKKSSGPAPQPPAQDNYTTNGEFVDSDVANQFEVSVLSGSKLGSIAADETDNPKYYAVSGKLVSRKNAVRRARAGDTLCMTRLRRYTPRNGDVIPILKVKAGLQEDTKSLYYVTLSHSGTRRKSIAILCMKYEAALTLTDVQNALSGIAEIHQVVN